MPQLSGGFPVKDNTIRSGLDIHLGVEHDLWCPVPAGGYVLRQEPRMVVVGIGHASQTKVTDLGRDDRETERQRDIETERQRDRQRDRETERHRDRET